ncbi:MAG: SDR family NAD(P)-dependent oxidoreductase [Parvibaculaceae bacterium]|nr:SDR family NAD(P)-dependent oxidoreductase [Parvibaculaceae bacterium]
MPKTALVIGATGGIGSETVLALQAHGWRVRAMNRNPGEAARRFRRLGAIEWVEGDSMKPGDVIRAASGVQIIFHGANPAGYKNWKGTIVPMMRSTIEAARASGARILLPGTLYNFGPDAWPVVSSVSPQNPLTRKGRIRVGMEEMLAREIERGGVRAIIVRAGDFFGPGLGNSWFASAIARKGKETAFSLYPGSRHVGHSWAYLPDLAETFARIADREAELPAFDVFMFEGHWFERGVEISHAVGRAIGKPDMPVRRFPWPLFYLAAPFVGFCREVIEMRYLWKVPIRLDNRKLVAFLGVEPHTDTDRAIRSALQGVADLQPEPEPEAVAIR